MWERSLVSLARPFSLLLLLCTSALLAGDRERRKKERRAGEKGSGENRQVFRFLQECRQSQSDPFSHMNVDVITQECR